MTRRTFWFGAGAISLVSLWLRAGFPVYAPGESTYDDMLFMKLAGSLGSGHWLGPYNDLTLANEIDDACRTGKLACLPRRATMLPPFRWHYLTDAIGPAVPIAALLFHLGDGRIGAAPSEARIRSCAFTA